MTITSAPHVVIPASMPNPQKLAAAVQDVRGLTSLDLANEARDSSDDADAVRTYAKIWEDLHSGRPRGPATTPEHRMTYTRDFVSHPTINSPDVLAFLQSELGKPVN